MALDLAKQSPFLHSCLDVAGAKGNWRELVDKNVLSIRTGTEAAMRLAISNGMPFDEHLERFYLKRATAEYVNISNENIIPKFVLMTE